MSQPTPSVILLYLKSRLKSHVIWYISYCIYAYVYNYVHKLFVYFHSTFLPLLEKAIALGVNSIGELFLEQAEKLAALYVSYCQGKTASEQLIVTNLPFFNTLQRYVNLDLPLSSYLIKPVQRITKYPLLLKVIIITHVIQCISKIFNDIFSNANIFSEYFNCYNYCLGFYPTYICKYIYKWFKS